MQEFDGIPFDPDKCYLSIDQITEMGDVLIKRWETSPVANKKWILFVKGAKWFVKRQNPKDVENYYKETAKLMFFMMLKNARAADKTLSMLPEPEPPEPVYCKPASPKLDTDWIKSFRHGGMKE